MAVSFCQVWVDLIFALDLQIWEPKGHDPAAPRPSKPRPIPHRPSNTEPMRPPPPNRDSAPLGKLSFSKFTPATQFLGVLFKVDLVEKKIGRFLIYLVQSTPIEGHRLSPKRTPTVDGRNPAPKKPWEAMGSLVFYKGVRESRFPGF